MNLPLVRVVIADDEPLARTRLRALLRLEPDCQLVGEARTGLEAVALIRARRPDLALLDIRMPGLNGFEVLSTLKEFVPPTVIFVTAFGEHALEAFQAGAVDYLLKPFEPQRFRRALQRARSRTSTRAIRREPASFPIIHEKISLRVEGRTVLVALDEISHLLARNSRSEVWMGSQSWLVNEPLGSLQGRLPANRFVRVSRFAIVNLAHVIALRTKSHGDQLLELRHGWQLTVARTRRSEVMTRLAL